MAGLLLLITMTGMAMLVLWVIRHDKAPDGQTRGLYAMREPEQRTSAGQDRLQGNPGARGASAARPSSAATSPRSGPRPAPARRDARLPFQED